MDTRLALGQGTVLRRSLRQEHFDRFAELSGDRNPIHVDQQFAARTPFGGTVAHGMLLYGLIGSILRARIPGPGSVQVRQELAFFYPTFAGEELTFLVWVIARDERSATLNTVAAKPDGAIACQGQALVLLPGAGFWGERYEPVGRAENGHGQGGSPQSGLGLEVGQRATVTRVFTAEELRAHDELLSDIDQAAPSAAASAEGAPVQGSPIPGNLLGGMISQLLGMRLPGPGTNWLKQTLVFPSLAKVGEEITATVEVSRVRPRAGLVNLITTCTGPGGSVVCGGEALVLFRGPANPSA